MKNGPTFRRRDVSKIKRAYHAAGMKRLPTLRMLVKLGIVEKVSRSEYRLVAR
jgi:hypothetical protein